MIRSVATVVILGAMLTAAGPAETNAQPAELGASGLTCEYAVDPLGVDTAQPRFGWVLQSDKRGQTQPAYQILVAGSTAKLGADVGHKWDSGKANSDRSANVDYMVDQGATTIWETWGGYAMAHGYPGAESMIMWATIDEFFYNDLAGIRGPEYYGPGQMTPGFRRIEIRPYVVGDLTHAQASVRTVQGVISSGWKKDGNALTLDVTIPAGASANVSVPAMGLKNVAIAEGGKTVWKNGAYAAGAVGITGASQSADGVAFDVGSGAYSFRLTGE